ncbi:hypothetical protein BASA50_007901 [Batrachochytrium salamandrivorans]|uniref:Uncharacterized protein n=1 Tax=Batrachochytrium salamandrivorans TaxID=1357716 RepID=A0ABQ8F5Q5_9FUNG|nr:hypothetical protein BASA62_003012 [Batrachochytrium salamandrivorans]KAH6581687.1 hypothetical protein BASA60_002274 [Batrachochytrium salamandrivorans]KAH6592722.1 hypothetical protein BASA50_007901 [Batrachochytrium salamandrivorans]KAH6602342.1 hypothetical protein BASA61_001216 [Batrachochytrium salamandrivorans]KAH9271204.1 hypothetical protein BASA83_006522 [Batrachochytrium salamandrivorans]
MSATEELYTIFASFCQYGSSRNLSGSASDISGPTMDGSKWAKFCRDSGFIGKSITATDFDIWFNKVKAKTARKIDFDQFQAALHLVAEKRYGANKSPTEAYMLIIRDITNGGTRPVTIATSTTNDAVTQRLTDHTQYTGTHKGRFGSNGNGLGMAGRDTNSKTNELSKIVNRKEANVRGVSIDATDSSQSKGYTAATIPKRTHQSVSTVSSEALDAKASKPKKGLPPIAGRSESNNKLSDPTPLTASAKKAAVGSSGNVYDRLTDTKGYTGTQKERFGGSKSSIRG